MSMNQNRLNIETIVIFSSVFFLMLSSIIPASADIYLNYSNTTGSKWNYSTTSNTSKLPSFINLTGGDIEIPSVTLEVYINNVHLTSGNKSLRLSSGSFGPYTTSDIPKQKVYVANSGRAIVNYSVKAHLAFANYAVNISTYKQISSNIPFYSDMSVALLDFNDLKNKWSSNSTVLNELVNTTGDSNLENQTTVTLDASGDYNNGSLNLSAGNYLILVTNGTDPKQIITSTIVKVMPFNSTFTVPTTGTIGSDVSVSVNLTGAPLENYTYISSIIKWTDYNNDIGNINISWTSGHTLVQSVRINGTPLETANSLTDIIPRSNTTRNTTNSTNNTLTLNTASLPAGTYFVHTVVFNSTNQSVAFNQSTITLSAATSITTNTTIPGIGANGSNSSELISTPLGNFSYTIVAGPNGTSPVNLSVTVQVSPPSGVATQTNSTATGGLGAGAMPDLYFNYSVDDPAWYDNVSYIHMRMYYNQSNIPSNVDESTLRPSRYLSNATSGSRWVKLECGTCPRTLEIVTDPDGHNRSVILKASGVNTTDNYVWANITHYSSYGVAGTVTSTTPPSGGGGGGSSGGGGGGGGMSGENASNIEVIEKYDLQISKDALTSYRFTNAKNPIMFVNITGNTSLGIITTSIEVLKDTSTLVTVPPEGLVYKNANIWVGTSGFATPKNIKEALITFRIDNAWINDNNLAGSDIVLVKWDGSQWIKLETSEKETNDAYTYFEAKTNSFSPYVIVAKVPEITPVITPVFTQQPITTQIPTEVPTEPTGIRAGTYLLIAVAIILIVIIAAGVNLMRKRKENK